MLRRITLGIDADSLFFGDTGANGRTTRSVWKGGERVSRCTILLGAVAVCSAFAPKSGFYRSAKPRAGAYLRPCSKFPIFQNSVSGNAATVGLSRPLRQTSVILSPQSQEKRQPPCPKPPRTAGRRDRSGAKSAGAFSCLASERASYPSSRRSPSPRQNRDPGFCWRAPFPAPLCRISDALRGQGDRCPCCSGRPHAAHSGAMFAFSLCLGSDSAPEGKSPHRGAELGSFAFTPGPHRN